jgi:uncharacterized protein
MLKLLLTLVVVVLALMWWFGKARGKDVKPADPQKPAKAAKPARMVECAHCGLHLPWSDAIEGEGGRQYCGAEHRRLGPAAPR